LTAGWKPDKEKGPGVEHPEPLIFVIATDL